MYISLWEGNGYAFRIEFFLDVLGYTKINIPIILYLSQSKITTKSYFRIYKMYILYPSSLRV